MKAFLSFLLFLLFVSTAHTGSIKGNENQIFSGDQPGVDKSSGILTDSIPPDPSGMRDMKSVEIAKEMIPGWNIGNTLEATGGETMWGNPPVNQQLIDSLKAAGFRAIRIPVAWSNFMDTSNPLYPISPALLDRVETVVNYVLKDSMYVLLNEHWDGGWMQPTLEQQDYVNNRLAIMWKQIAIRFRDYGDHLIFAGMNEVMVTNDYSAPKPAYLRVQNSFLQTFVSTVRSTGGRNAYRHLAVQGFNTNIGYTLSGLVIPTDVTPNRLMVEVHYYDPYNFTINTGSGSTNQWGNNAAIKTDTWANEVYADGQFKSMKTKFIDKGYGVLLGEYGVVARLNLGSAELNASQAAYRRYYTQYITRSMERYGVVPFWWDAGSTTNNGMGLFNRSTGAQAYPEIVRSIIDTNYINLTTTEVQSSNAQALPATFSLLQNFPNPFNPSTTIAFTLPSKSFVTLKVYDLIGREIATLVSEELSAGTYSKQWNAATMSSGMYVYQMHAGTYTETKKLVLLR
jgi:endoglucanase